MFVITRARLAVAVQDGLALVASVVRRTVRVVTAASDKEVGVFRGEIVNHGSSWAALNLALEVRPVDLPELLQIAGVYELSGARRKRAFDACVDGYAVFHDGRLRRKL